MTPESVEVSIIICLLAETCHEIAEDSGSADLRWCILQITNLSFGLPIVLFLVSDCHVTITIRDEKLTHCRKVNWSGLCRE
jgi:hypothetical protein